MSDGTYLTREEAIGVDEGTEFQGPDLAEAVRACLFWFQAEHSGFGTFYERMGLCDYAEWCCRKALGFPHDPEWKGVPTITIALKEASHGSDVHV